MTRKTSFITAVGAALVLVPAAWGQPAPDAVDRAVAQQQQADFWNYENGTKITNTSPGMSPQDVSQLYTGVSVGETQWQQALNARSEALNQQHGLGEYATNPIDARERALVEKHEVQLGTSVSPDAFERAVAANGRTQAPIVGDDRFRIDPSTNPVPVTGTDTGREIDWPQIGVGFGVGMLLALGLFVAMRATRQRPIAH